MFRAVDPRLFEKGFHSGLLLVIHDFGIPDAVNVEINAQSGFGNQPKFVVGTDFVDFAVVVDQARRRAVDLIIVLQIVDAVVFGQRVL